jgi:predicted ATPase
VAVGRNTGRLAPLPENPPTILTHTPLNVLTGPNGSGKSNLYNSVFLLAKAASGGFARAIAEEGGMASVFWAGKRNPRSRASSRSQPVRVVLGVKTDSVSYELSCGLSPRAPDDPTAFKLDPE